MPFLLATVVSSNPFFLTMRIDKVKWMTAHNCGKQKWHSFMLSLSWKGKFWVLTLSHKICPRKQITELKLVILVSYLSGEFTSYTDTNYCIHLLWEVSHSGFFSGPPCVECMALAPFWFSMGYRVKALLVLISQCRYHGVCLSKFSSRCQSRVLKGNSGTGLTYFQKKE